MRTRTVLTQFSGLVFALTGSVTAASAQSLVSARTSVIYENYSYGSGFAVGSINQFSVPVVLGLDFGRVGTLAISTGYTQVKLTSADTDELPNQDLSGTVDTELRWTVELIPGRLYALANGTLPTGINRFQSGELAILGVLTTDVIGFSAPSLGGGGDVGGGVVAAVPVGSWALGLGGTFSSPMSFQPLASDPSNPSLQPGSEVRLRAGLEGALGRRTYVRIAGVYSARQKDQLAGAPQHGVGNRFVGYLSVNQGFGDMTATAYVFDVFRADPILESGLDANVLPRGNLASFGARMDIPFTPATKLTPTVEYRVSHKARSETDTKLRWLARSVRVGTALRHRLSRRFGLVAQGSYLGGTLRVPSGVSQLDVSISGYRAEFHLEWNP